MLAFLSFIQRSNSVYGDDMLALRSFIQRSNSKQFLGGEIHVLG